MFFIVVSENAAMNGKTVRGVREETLKEVVYVLVEFCFFGLKQYTWYQKVQLQPTTAPEAWFGAPPKQEWITA